MAASTPNPITERLTRRWKVPLAREAWLLGVIAGTLGAVISCAAVVPMQPAAFFTTLLILALAVIAMCVGLVACLIAGAVITGRYAVSEEFALLRTTGLSARVLFDGFFASVEQFMRWTRALAVCSPLAMLGGLTFLIGEMSYYSIGFACVLDRPDCYLEGFLVAILTIALAIPGLHLATRELMAVGVWLGLRWPRQAALIAGGAGLIGAMLCVGLGPAIVVWPLGMAYGPLVCLAVPAAMLIAVTVLGNFARADALRRLGGPGDA